MEKEKLEKTIKQMQLCIESDLGEIDHSREAEELGTEIQNLEANISELMQNLRIEIFG